MGTLPSRSKILGNDKQLSTHSVLWDGLGVDSHVMSLADNCIQFWKFGEKYSSITEDKTIKFWDLRNSKRPLKVLSNHSHWIWCSKYNRYHDQLIISSGSDSNVSLWNIVSVSSAPLGEMEDNSKEEDKLIKTYREHEESVYWTSWSANNAWVFASLSYDGRVVINHVPAATQYKILL